MYLLCVVRAGIIKTVEAPLLLILIAPIFLRSVTLLTESEVSRSWTRLFKDGNFTTDLFESAENLLDELRPESPLRHRLSSELTELQKIHGAEMKA